MVSEKAYNMSSFRKGIPTHSTIDNNDGRQDNNDGRQDNNDGRQDNNDGRQDTVKGSGTTHDTNITMFQLPNEDEVHLQNAPVELSGVSTDVSYKVPRYHIGRRVRPLLFEVREDDRSRGELDYCLKRDIAWSAAGSVVNDPDDDSTFDPLGSWTAFLRLVL